MPTVREIFDSYRHGGIQGDRGRYGLTFVPPLYGLIKPPEDEEPGRQHEHAPKEPEYFLFSKSPGCILWIPIPLELIESIDLLSKQACRGQEYDYVRITLKLPSTPEAKMYAGLMLSQHSCTCGSRSARNFAAVHTEDDLSDFAYLCGSIYDAVSCNSTLLHDCRSPSRCHEGFRVLREVHDAPSRQTVQRLSDWMNASSMQESCMKAIIRESDKVEWAEFIAMIAAILA